MSALTCRLVGGPTAIVGYGGLRWLTDPTLSEPGEYEGGLVKTTGPAVAAADLGAIDVVLISHDHHADNLDPAGREFTLASGARVFTTTAGAQRLGAPVEGLDEWATATVGDVTVTAVPALHGPPGCEEITGPVIGFVLSAEGQPTVYVAGDNASLDVVAEIADRCGPIEIAILNAGAVQIPQRFDGRRISPCRPTALRWRRSSSARRSRFRCISKAGPTSRRARTSCAPRSLATASASRLRLPARGETVEA